MTESAKDKKNYLRLLCFGVDPILIANLLTRPEAAHLSFDLCEELEDAQDKIGVSHYDLALLSYKQPASCKILISRIKSKNTSVEIVVLANSGTTAAEIEEIKQDPRVNYCLPKHQVEIDLDAIIKRGLEKKSTKISDRSHLKELKANYDATIPDKLEVIEKFIYKIKSDPIYAEPMLLELKREIHKIAGAAGSYGYQPVTLLCKAMENQLEEQIQSHSVPKEKWLISLDHFYERVKEGFTNSTFLVPENQKYLSAHVKPLLYVVDDDIHFLELLERIKESFPLTLVTDSDPIMASKRLQEPDFNPSGLVVSQKFPSNPLSGYDLIKVALGSKKTKIPVVALLMSKHSIENRLEAIEKGSQYVFSKPISAPVLLKSMAEALDVYEVKPLKILIVDDDIDFCDYMEAILREIGATPSFIHNPVELYEEIELFNPDILLLDIMMPNYDGIKLLQTLRQDIRLNNLIVIIVTASEKIDTKINAYVANVDDIIFKPIDKNVFQKRLLNIAERRKETKESVENYTGLYQLKELMQDINEKLEHEEGAPGYLVLFDVNKFADWTREHGHTSAKDLIIYISNALQWDADKSMKYFWYKNSIFAITFEKVDYEDIEKRMFAFLSHLVHAKSDLHLNFNCSIVPITHKFKNAPRILQVAEEALYEENKHNEHTVHIIHKLPTGVIDTQKEIMIIDPNQSLLKILTHSFEAHGIKVKAHIEGSEALKDIISMGDDHHPALIIVERQLPDMDGMDLCIELKNRFKTPIPFFMLTVFAADKDVSDGLSKGVEYIVKPFNISLLLQKALQVLSQN